MAENPYQTLDAIYDLLLTLIPDRKTAMRCAEGAGIPREVVDESLDLVDLLRDIVAAAHQRHCLRELLAQVAALYPEQERTLTSAYEAYAAARAPNPLSPPPLTIETLPGEIEAFVPETVEALGGRDLPSPVEVASAVTNGHTKESPQAPAAPRSDEVLALRLDTAIPKSVTVGEAFQLAVAVRQTTSPLLGRDNLPVVESGDLQVLWPAGAAYITLRTQISAPDCTIDGPDSDTFRLFAGRDSPVLIYHLTPQRAGSISIYVTIYQEEDRLGTAGVLTKARTARRRKTTPATPTTPVTPTVAGKMEVKVQSLTLAAQATLAALEPLHDLFVELFGRDRDAPRILAEQAGLDVSRIPYSPISSDYLWNVLVEGHQRHAIAALVEQAIERKAEREADLRAAEEKYEQLTIDN